MREAARAGGRLRRGGTSAADGEVASRTRRVGTADRGQRWGRGLARGKTKKLEQLREQRQAALVREREQRDRLELERLGGILDRPFRALKGNTPLIFLAEKLLKVRGKDGRLHALRPNAAQRAFEERRGEANIVLKARQIGMTTWVAGRFLLKTVTRPGTLTLLVAHTQDAAEEILRIVHRYVEHLPPVLTRGVLTTDRQNVRQIAFPKIDSEFRVVSASDRNAGRGMTVQNLHCSEVSRWPGDGAETLAGLRACLAPSRDGAEIVLESTPNGASGCFYDEWVRAGETGMVRHFFPWWMEAGYRGPAVEEESLNEEELELFVERDLDLEQIAYRRRMLAEQGALARQEFAEDAERCFLVSGEMYFDREAVERRLAELGGPMDRERNGRLEIYLPPVCGRRYLVAVDPAGGGAEGDYSVAEVLDLESGMQCAEFAAHVGGSELAREVAGLARRYNEAPVVVERNNHGAAVLLALGETVGYHEVWVARDGQPGWLTTTLSRPVVLARLAAVIEENGGCLMSRGLLMECRSFVRLANGSVGARSGTHDDRVMAMAIGLAAREQMLGGRTMLHSTPLRAGNYRRTG